MDAAKSEEYPPTMGHSWLIPFTTVVATVILMEALAGAVHRYVMHGWGWGWHRSHHQPGPGMLELNDLYAVIFAANSVLLFMLSGRWPLLWWIGFGLAAYGLLYTLLHDGLVHCRLPVRLIARRGYLKRLVQAHRLHHAIKDRNGAVSFGFLYAPPVAKLIRDLRENRNRR